MLAGMLAKAKSARSVRHFRDELHGWGRRPVRPWAPRRRPQSCAGRRFHSDGSLRLVPFNWFYLRLVRVAICDSPQWQIATPLVANCDFPGGDLPPPSGDLRPFPLAGSHPQNGADQSSRIRCTASTYVSSVSLAALCSTTFRKAGTLSPIFSSNTSRSSAVNCTTPEVQT